MTKCVSAAYMKVNGKDYRCRSVLPREGTKLRRLYDLFMMYRGHAIPYDTAFFICGSTKNFRSFRTQLEDYYGMDIRGFPLSTRGALIPSEMIRKNMKVWCLVGEWKDGEYLDYVAATFNEVTLNNVR